MAGSEFERNLIDRLAGMYTFQESTKAEIMEEEGVEPTICDGYLKVDGMNVDASRSLDYCNGAGETLNRAIYDARQIQNPNGYSESWFIRGLATLRTWDEKQRAEFFSENPDASQDDYDAADIQMSWEDQEAEADLLDELILRARTESDVRPVFPEISSGMEP